MASLVTPAKARGFRGISIAFTILVAMLLGITLGSLLAAIIATQFFGFSVLTLQSDSMAPALHRGDVLVVRPTSISDVEPGDIVVYETGGDKIRIAHRVTGVIVLFTNNTDPDSNETTVTSTAYRLQTRGDGADNDDWDLVDATSLLGIVWFSVPGIGIGMGGLQLQTALLIIAGFTLIGWIAWELRAQAVSGKRSRRQSPYD
jgi:signal peptidase I